MVAQPEANTRIVTAKHSRLVPPVATGWRGRFRSNMRPDTVTGKQLTRVANSGQNAGGIGETSDRAAAAPKLTSRTFLRLGFSSAAKARS